MDTEKVDEINVKSAAQKNDTETAVAVPECGSCYGAETNERKCCNTCEEVQDAYRNKGWGVQDYSKFEQCKNGMIKCNIMKS